MSNETETAQASDPKKGERCAVCGKPAVVHIDKPSMPSKNNPKFKTIALHLGLCQEHLDEFCDYPEKREKVKFT